MQFEDRASASDMLAEKLIEFKQNIDSCVIGIARSGMVVAARIAQNLKLPLDVMVSHKISDGDDGIIVGAITAGGATYFNQSLMQQLHLTIQMLSPSIEKSKLQAAQQFNNYRQNKHPLILNNKIVILVDDGIIMPEQTLAAVNSIKLLGAIKIVIAVPIISRQAIPKLSKEVDEIVCLYIPEKAIATHQFYKNYAQVTDEEVTNLLF